MQVKCLQKGEAMKKFLALFGLLCAFCLAGVACEEEPVHTHAFGEWQTTLVATCEAMGEESRSCACGVSEKRNVTPTGQHQFEEGDSCTVCHATKMLFYKLSEDKMSYIVFKNDENLTQVVVPSYYKGKPVTVVGSSAFYPCRQLVSITLPETITSIELGAFEYCASLKSIVLPSSLTTLGESAFSHCSSLESVTLPQSLLTIGDSAFRYCSSLKKITLPLSLTHFGKSTFVSCTALTEIAIPASVTHIGSYAFSGCSALSQVMLPSTLVEIGDSAFVGCQSLSEISIPASVARIGAEAFLHCDALSNVTLEQPAGWQYENMGREVPLAADVLAEPGMAATYLKKTYVPHPWIRR